jgi:hypothetical protein
MTDTPERDPLEELLAPPGPVDTAALRLSLLTTTTRRLRQACRLRRVVLIAALAACYGAGLLTMQLLTPAHNTPAPLAEESKQNLPPTPVAIAPESAPTAERRAEQAPDPERASLLRQAGQRYLNEEGDPEAALRCYSKSLNAGTEDDAKFSPNDDWLLMAIKNAREKESRHANNDG